MLRIAVVGLIAAATMMSTSATPVRHFGSSNVALRRQTHADPAELLLHKLREAYLVGRAREDNTVCAGYLGEHKKLSEYEQRKLNAELSASQRAIDQWYSAGFRDSIDGANVGDRPLPANVLYLHDIPATFDNHDEAVHKRVIGVVERSQTTHPTDDDDDSSIGVHACKLFCDELYAVVQESRPTDEGPVSNGLSLHVVSRKTGRSLATVGRLSPRAGSLNRDFDASQIEAISAAMHPRTGELYVLVDEDGSGDQFRLLAVDVCTAQYRASASQDQGSFEDELVDLAFDSHGRLFIVGKSDIAVVTDLLDFDITVTDLNGATASSDNSALAAIRFDNTGKHTSLVGSRRHLVEFDFEKASVTGQARPSTLDLGDSLTIDADGVYLTVSSSRSPQLRVADDGLPLSNINIVDTENNRIHILNTLALDIRGLVAPNADVCQKKLGERKKDQTCFPDDAKAFAKKLADAKLQGEALLPFDVHCGYCVDGNKHVDVIQSEKLREQCAKIESTYDLAFDP